MKIKTSLSVAVIIALFIFTDILFGSFPNSSENERAKEENSFMYLDSSKIKEVVYKEGKGFIAIGKSGNELFEIFPFDNGPDYPSEGLFRIIKNEKIGFADEMGNVAIEPQFTAALPFQNGLAAICEGCAEVSEFEHKTWKVGTWGFINHTGKIVIPPKYDQVVDQFDKGIAKVEYAGAVILINKSGVQVKMGNMKFTEWIELLGSATKLLAKTFFGDKLKVELSWHDNNKFVFGAKDYWEYLRIVIINYENFEVLEYNIIPWQNFSIKPGSDFLISLEEVSTVTDYAVIYSTFKLRENKKNDIKLIEEFNKLFAKATERDLNHQPQNIELALPENVQFISKNIYRYFLDLQIALPGTILPNDSAWVNLCKGKMIYLQLIPDITEIKKRWIKTADRPTDTYYTSVEENLLKYFSEALTEANNSPARRKEIFENTKHKMRALFSAANTYVNFLYDKYETRLSRWLFIEEATWANQPKEKIFEDYQPKRTPDTVLDYMPALNDELKILPDTKLENYSSLLQLLKLYQLNSKANPGQWEEGNMILGAQPKEYRPSKDELLASEIGDRLVKILNTHPKEKIIDFLKKSGLSIPDLEYTHFSFTHVDVMGSGRFFYVQSMEKINLNLK